MPKPRLPQRQPMPETALTPGQRVNMAAYLRLLRGNANFRRLWGAQIISELGDWFYILSIYSLLLQYTGKAQSVALALIVQVLPQTLISPIAGIINDRFSRKKVMIASDLLRCVVVLAMLLVRSSSMVWLAYLLLFTETLMWGFFEPARTAVIPNIVGPEDIVVANTLSSTTWSLNLVLGAAVGGVVAALVGRQSVFVINAASFLLSALLISRMKFIEGHVEVGEKMRLHHFGDLSSIREGIAYIRSDVRRVALILLKAGHLCIGPSWVIFTVMGRQDYPVQRAGLSLEQGAMLGMSILMGARGLGALLGPLLTAPWAGQNQKRLRYLVLFGFCAEAVGYFCIGLSHNIWTAMFWIVLGHFGGAIIWVFSTTLLQLNTDDKFSGRVFSADLGLCMFSIAATAFLSGYALDHGATTRMVAMATGAMMILPLIAWAYAQRLWREPANLS